MRRRETETDKISGDEWENGCRQTIGNRSLPLTILTSKRVAPCCQWSDSPLSNSISVQIVKTETPSVLADQKGGGGVRESEGEKERKECL